MSGTLSLIVCTFTYLLVGAAIFDALESENEIVQDRILREKEKQIREYYRISQEDLSEMEKHFVRKKGINEVSQWRFAGAFYFSTTVITTIGYGHNTPTTDKGKIFCMLYALPGIPLCITMFQSIGERMNAGLTAILRSIKKCLKCRNSDVSQTNLIFVSGNICLIVVVIGAVVFSYYEGWNMLDSLYYCFITLTTIGFGDFVALKRDNSISRRPDYVAFSLIFILFGLTVVSSAMNLMILRFLTMNTKDEQNDELAAAVADYNTSRNYDEFRRKISSITSNSVFLNGRIPILSVESRPSYACNHVQNRQNSIAELYKTSSSILTHDIRTSTQPKTSILNSFRFSSQGADTQTNLTRFNLFNYFRRNTSNRPRAKQRFTRIRAPCMVHHLAQPRAAHCSSFIYRTKKGLKYNRPDCMQQKQPTNNSTDDSTDEEMTIFQEAKKYKFPEELQSNVVVHL